MIAAVLATGECHVWWAVPQEWTVDSLASTLSERELERAARFRREPDLRRFLTGSWLLRTVAAAQLGISPGEVEVDRSCPDCTRYHGKPHIVAAGPPLHVSVSHSGDRVVVALTGEGPLGVDVEAVPSEPVDDLARCALTRDERLALEALPREERYEAFTKVWVRKEAALKATGHGLRVSPSTVEVSSPAADPKLLSWPLDIAPDRVRFEPLHPGHGYVAAVAVLDADRPVRVREYHVPGMRPVTVPDALVAA
ncbi:MAG TPA: 4'-phosphopantetheinyl transferase superfamily protein [Nonomuraea sp.]|nr:4'-phosphopantetheinyl transferase superfamily protein [Nonomuraea sp.]